MSLWRAMTDEGMAQNVTTYE